MKRIFKNLLLLPTTGLTILPIVSCKEKTEDVYIDVSKYCDSTGQQDCADKIQELINNNPHKTLFFKDGTYLLSHQIATPGDPDKSVSLKLSSFACLKAMDNFQIKRSGEYEPWQDEYLYMISLGGLDRVNDTTKVGSNFYMEGGYVDGNGKAAGVEIGGGREVRVQNVSMKGVVRGLRIAPGVNSNSSDADVLDLNIICNGATDSLGLDIDGYDNTITNVRIGKTLHGVDVFGGGNMLRNIHPLHGGYSDDIYDEETYAESYGFATDEPNYFDYCYSDNFGIGFKILNGRAVFNDCVVWWYNGRTNKETVIKYIGDDETHHFRSIFTNLSMGFSTEAGCKNTNVVLDTNQIETRSESTTVGYIHNIAICHRDTLASSANDQYHVYHSGVDADY